MSRNSHVDKSVTDADIDEACRALRSLPPEPRQVVEPDVSRACSLAEVAAELGVSSERVRQIERAALQKARRILERKGLTLDDFLT